MMNDTPVAWMYELASFYDKGVYSGWRKYVTFHKPCVPEAAIKNLTPLYTKVEE